MPEPPQAGTCVTFHPFPRLPNELQLAVWKYAFLLGPLRSHDSVLVCSASHLNTAFTNRQRLSQVDAWDRQGIPRADRVLMKFVYAPNKHEISSQNTVIGSNSCVEGNFCRYGITIQAVSRCTKLLGEGSRSKYRLVLFRGTELCALLETCRLARLGCLESWRNILVDMLRHEKDESRRSPRQGPWRKGEKILDVVKKMIQ